MRNLRMQSNRVAIRKARTTLACCLLVSAAILGLIATNEAVEQTCTPPPPNMVSWWPGEGNANDIQGSNNGTLQDGARRLPRAWSDRRLVLMGSMIMCRLLNSPGLPFVPLQVHWNCWMQPGINAPQITGTCYEITNCTNTTSILSILVVRSNGLSLTQWRLVGGLRRAVASYQALT